MKDEQNPPDNVINLHPHKPNVLSDLDIHNTSQMNEEDTHNYVLASLDKVQEHIRNHPKTQGAFIISFSSDGATDNWIMGDIPIPLLYTAVSSFQQEILKVFNKDEHSTLEGRE